MDKPKFDPSFEYLPHSQEAGEQEERLPNWSSHCIEDCLVVRALKQSGYEVRFDKTGWYDVSPAITTNDVRCVGGKIVYSRGTLLTFETASEFYTRLDRIRARRPFTEAEIDQIKYRRKGE